MAFLNELTKEDLDEEVRELLLNYKFKKATTYEPCTNTNFRECLIGISEELGLLNINYLFNPLTDAEHDTLRPEALVKLINSIWTLLQYHKNVTEKSGRLVEQNHIFEQNNKQLNATVGILKEKLSLEKNEAKACVASAQRIADHSDDMLQKLTETQAKLTQVTKQKIANERGLRNEITRLKLNNEKMLHKLRNNGGKMSCGDVCDATVVQLKEREKRQRVMIAQLQRNNQDLLQELLGLKEELILGVDNLTFNDK